MVKYTIYDAFPKKKTAKRSANDLRKAGDRVLVKKLIKPQDSGRLKWAIYTGGRRRRKFKK
jgi:hypothetical protein